MLYALCYNDLLSCCMCAITILLRNNSSCNILPLECPEFLKLPRYNLHNASSYSVCKELNRSKSLAIFFTPGLVYKIYINQLIYWILSVRSDFDFWAN